MFENNNPYRDCHQSHWNWIKSGSSRLEPLCNCCTFESIHFKWQGCNLYVMLSGQHKKNELNCRVLKNSTHAQLNISSPNWCFKNSLVCFPITGGDIQSGRGYGPVFLCVSLRVCLSCWIMAGSLCGVEGHLAKLKSGRCRRKEERGRAGRLTTYWWNEKSLAQPDNLPPPHLVMNAVQQRSSTYSHTALCGAHGSAQLSIFDISTGHWHVCWWEQHNTTCVLHYQFWKVHT